MRVSYSYKDIFGLGITKHRNDVCGRKVFACGHEVKINILIRSSADPEEGDLENHKLYEFI